ncbi:MAG: ATP-binding protein [Coriobacteriia bacterium]|nr:ATP-binding protein [Coriobacteriia bacterium]
MIGRANERRLLMERAEREDAQLVVLYGRRRVGKTYLVRETFNNDFFFVYTGLERVTKRRQLEEFNKALLRFGCNKKARPKDWFEAFDRLGSLIELHDSARKVIFIDEMPWMDNRGSEFITAFEAFWNGRASAAHRLCFIVCGSAASWITKKILHNRGGLYNRATQRIRLLPFTLFECEEFFEAREVRLNRYDVICSYQIFGGIPYYLDNFNKRYSLAQNVDRLCFGSEAHLANEYEDVFKSLFVNSEKHREVVEALSNKKKGLTRQQVKEHLSFADGGNLTRVIKELEMSGFIREYHPFGKKKKGSLLQLSDPFTLFHLSWMKGRQQGHEGFWSQMLGSGAHNAWSGYAFEQVCLAHIPQIKQALGIAGVLTSCSSWSSSPREGRGSQIDLVLERADNIINLCEMKFSNQEYTVDKKEDMALRDRRGAFMLETRTRKAVRLTLVTTYGLKQSMYSSIYQSVVSMDDLFC